MNFFQIDEETPNHYINLDNIKEIKFTGSYKSRGDSGLYEEEVKIWYLGEVACEKYWFTERIMQELRNRLK
jgi:hypothetical protein